MFTGNDHSYLAQNKLSTCSLLMWELHFTLSVPMDVQTIPKVLLQYNNTPWKWLYVISHKSVWCFWCSHLNTWILSISRLYKTFIFNPLFMYNILWKIKFFTWLCKNYFFIKIIIIIDYLLLIIIDNLVTKHPFIYLLKCTVLIQWVLRLLIHYYLWMHN